MPLKMGGLPLALASHHADLLLKTLNAKTLIAVLTSLLSPNPVVSNILCVYACFSKERSEPYQVVRNRQGEQIMRHSTFNRHYFPYLPVTQVATPLGEF